MSSKYRVTPVASPAVLQRKGSFNGGSGNAHSTSATPPRRRPSVNHAINNLSKQLHACSVNDEDGDTELITFDAEHSVDSRTGRGRSGSNSSRASPSVRGRKSFNEDSFSSTAAASAAAAVVTSTSFAQGNNNNNSENDSASNAPKARRLSRSTIADVQVSNSTPATFVKPVPLNRASSLSNISTPSQQLQSRSRRGSFEDDMSVSSVNSKVTAKPKPALRGGVAPSRRNSSAGMRKKKVQFRIPLADYHEHSGEYAEYSAEGDDEYGSGKNQTISFIPKRLRRRRGDDIGCNCCAFM